MKIEIICDKLFESTGQVESTEGTYKYHMQIQQSPDPTQSKTRQGPLKASLKPPKRRTHSSGSATSLTSEEARSPDTSLNKSISQVMLLTVLLKILPQFNSPSY